MPKRIYFLACFLAFIFLGCKNTVYTQVDTAAFEVLEKEHIFWQSERLETLLKADGWLSLIGLSWIDEGLNEMGSRKNCSIKLPQNFPQLLATLTLRHDSIYFESMPNVEVLSNKISFEKGYIDSDVDGAPTILRHNSLLWYVIKRGDKFGIRIKDTSLVSRIRFGNIPSFKFNPEYIVEAKVVTRPSNDSIKIVNIIGMESQNSIEAFLQFEYNGKKYKLTALDGGPKFYFVIFSDDTTGDNTYGGGRYIYVEKGALESNQVIIDFNRAFNPPCVFTDYATCPLPPEENHLTFKVLAGEMKMNGH